MSALPALRWPAATVRDTPPPPSVRRAARPGPGAEMETSRGCPYHCTFCAKDNLPRRVPQAAAGRRCSRSSTGSSSRGSVRLLHRRDLPARRALLEALVAAAGEVRRADAHRPVDARPARSARRRRAACPSRRGSRASRPEGRDAARQALPARPPTSSPRGWCTRQAQRAVRAGHADGLERDDPEAVEAWRGELQRARRVGERAGAAVPLSGLARLHCGCGARPTTGPGSARTTTTCARSTASATSGAAAACGLPSSREAASRERSGRRRVLMTADAVGGVWTYALELAAGLDRAGVAVVFAVMGPPPDRGPARRRRAASPA